MNIGDRIRNVRIAAKLSQSQLEKKTGIKREYLSKLENNQLKNPTIDTLIKITDGCEITLVKFLGGTQKNATSHQLTKAKIKLQQTEAELDKVYSVLKELVATRGK